MRCSSCEPLLDPYLETTLRPGERKAVAAHLSACLACTALFTELRVIDGLLATARAARVGADFTAAVVSAAQTTTPRAPRRAPLTAALALYLGVAWALAAAAAMRWHGAAGLTGALLAFQERNASALAAAVSPLRPAAVVAAAIVTGILLLDGLLICGLFYGYRRVRPLLRAYLGRGPRG